MSGRAVLPLFCLAPRGVYRAVWVTPKRGGLLLHHFNLTCASLAWGHRRYSFCCTFRPSSSRFLSLTFMRRVALWCPDFPQPCLRNTATVRGAALRRCTRRHDFQTKNASGVAVGRSADARGPEMRMRPASCGLDLKSLAQALAEYEARRASAFAGATDSWKSSFTMQTGALPQDARHSANSTENLPQGETEIGWW